MDMIKTSDVFLFQGDSITDAGRSRKDDNNLGSGYPMMLRAWCIRFSGISYKIYQQRGQRKQSEGSTEPSDG